MHPLLSIVKGRHRREDIAGKHRTRGGQQEARNDKRTNDLPAPGVEAASLTIGLACASGCGQDIRVPGRDKIPNSKAARTVEKTQTFRNNLSFGASRHAVCLTALVGVLAGQVFILAQEGAKPALPDPLAISREDQLKVFEKLWETVNKEYFDPTFNGVDWAKVKAQYRPSVEAARSKTQLAEVLGKMLNELNSSHLTVTFHAELDEARIAQELSRKSRRGETFRFDPGLSFTRVEEHRVVDSVAEGSGAQRAGVQRGWTLTHWSGEPEHDGLSTACDLGEKVGLRFVDVQGQERILDIVCQLYPIPPGLPQRTMRILDGDAVYLRFTGFAHGTNEWLDDQVTRHQRAPAIVLDLHGNIGGFDSVLRRCFEPFFSDATTLGEFRKRDGKELTLRVPGRGKRAYGGKVIVLIEETTMSVAEIFAAGIQESGRGVIIGRQSGGQVLMNVFRGLPTGFRATIAMRDYRTAKGIRLEQRGVIPDAPVMLTMKDFVDGQDPDLERVSELLKKGR